MAIQSAKTSTRNSPLAGSWILVKGNDKDLKASNISLMRSLGLNVTLTLKKNGKANLNLFGDVSKCTWKAKSRSKGTLTLNRSGAKLSLANGKLKLTDSSSKWLLFKRK